MKIIKVIYKGPRDGRDYDDFTFDNVYLAKESREGFLTVLNDSGLLVELPTIDFDFTQQEALI